MTSALRRLAEHRAAGDILVSWQQAAADLLAMSSRPVLRSACLAEAARLRPAAAHPRVNAGVQRSQLSGGVRRYGPPPRLQGAKGKTVRWRHVPTPT